MTRPSDIRKRLLKQRGVELARMTRKPVTVDDLPSQFHKTRAMCYTELKYGDRLEKLLYKGTIYEVGQKLGVHPSTVSKWKKIIDATFWAQFS